MRIATLNYIQLITNIELPRSQHDGYITILISDSDEKQREKVGIVEGKQLRHCWIAFGLLRGPAASQPASQPVSLMELVRGYLQRLPWCSQCPLLVAMLTATAHLCSPCVQVPNGELSSEQLRFMGESIAPYGEDGCADITTRANIQVRGTAQRGGLAPPLDHCS